MALQTVTTESGPPNYAALTVAVYGALLAGVAVTAVLHSAVGPTDQVGQSGALQWTSLYSVNNVAPLVAGATGFYAGRRGGLSAAAGSFAGNTAGYLLFFLGTYATNAAVLGVEQKGVRVAVQSVDGVGMGVVGVLFVVVAARWA